MFDTKKSQTWSQLKAGWIISIALMVLFLTIFFSGSIKGLFAPEAEINMRISNVSGLRQGAAVWLFGVEIGRVKNIKLGPEGSVVILSVNKNDLKFIKKIILLMKWLTT